MSVWKLRIGTRPSSRVSSISMIGGAPSLPGHVEKSATNTAASARGGSSSGIAGPVGRPEGASGSKSGSVSAHWRTGRVEPKLMSKPRSS